MRETSLGYQPDYVGPDWEAADHVADDRLDLLLIVDLHGRRLVSLAQLSQPEGVNR